MYIPAHTFLPLIGIIPYIILKFTRKDKLIFITKKGALILAVFCIAFTVVDGMGHALHDQHTAKKR